MTVNPGFGGQKFIAGAMDKVRHLRRRIDETAKARNGRPIDLEVDGGINAETAAIAARPAPMCWSPAPPPLPAVRNYAGNIRRLRDARAPVRDRYGRDIGRRRFPPAFEPMAPVLRARRMRLPRELQMQRLWYSLRQPVFRSAFYRWLLPGQVAGAPGPAIASDIWPAMRSAAAPSSGHRHLGGQTIRDPAPVWDPVGATDPWRETVHSFDWLRDLRAVSGESARRAARELVGRWIADNSRWSPVAWRPDITGRRLAAWILHYDFLGAAGDAMFRGRLLVSIAQQTSHLSRVLPAGLSGSDLLFAIGGLIHAGLVMPRGSPWMRRGVILLSHELERQILSDGCHCERSPSVHFEVLQLLVGRVAFGTADHTVPGRYRRHRPHGADAAFFEHGDGGCAVRDSNEEADWLIDMTLARANGRAYRQEAPVSGFSAWPPAAR
jgi:hypothetical protein